MRLGVVPGSGTKPERLADIFPTLKLSASTHRLVQLFWEKRSLRDSIITPGALLLPISISHHPSHWHRDRCGGALPLQ